MTEEAIRLLINPVVFGVVVLKVLPFVFRHMCSGHCSDPPATHSLTPLGPKPTHPPTRTLRGSGPQTQTGMLRRLDTLRCEESSLNRTRKNNHKTKPGNKTNKPPPQSNSVIFGVVVVKVLPLVHRAPRQKLVKGCRPLGDRIVKPLTP